MGEIIGPIIGGSVTELYSFDIACVTVSVLNLSFGVLFLLFNYKFIANFYYGNEVARQLRYVEINEYQSLRNMSLRNISHTGILGSLNDNEFEISLNYVSKKRRAKFTQRSNYKYTQLDNNPSFNGEFVSMLFL